MHWTTYQRWRQREIAAKAQILKSISSASIVANGGQIS